MALGMADHQGYSYTYRHHLFIPTLSFSLIDRLVLPTVRG